MTETRRANYIGAPQMFNLRQCCQPIANVFGECLYLVGSSIEKRDYRDIDVRCILPDEEFHKLFPEYSRNNWLDARLTLLNSTISEWLASRTGLPIDFQFQEMSEANYNHSKGERQPIIVLGGKK